MLRTNLSLARTLTLVAAIAPVVAQGQDHAVIQSTTLSSDGAPDNSAEIASRGAIIIREFSASDRIGWPYDVKQLQSQTVAELRAKAEGRFDVSVAAPATPRLHTYTLEGEIVSWRPGNRAKRLVVGMGSGRESAEIRYWLTDEHGKKVFEHKDTIRAEFWGNAYDSSVGALAHPFASKIAARLTEIKLFQ